MNDRAIDHPMPSASPSTRTATVSLTPACPTAPAPLIIANGTLEAMKWLALVLMTLDHVNKYLLDETWPLLFAVGRTAMPLFVFVLAYNLARPGVDSNGAGYRTTVRLACSGAFACVPFIALGKVYGGWWPLNIMFTLLVATLVIWLMQRGGSLSTTAALAVFIVGGALVEYWWFAPALAIASWRYCKQPNTIRLAATVACLVALWFLNRNPWALAALPLILAAPHLKLSLPRFSLFFYAYYPVHLGLLFVLSAHA